MFNLVEKGPLRNGMSCKDSSSRAKGFDYFAVGGAPDFTTPEVLGVVCIRASLQTT